VVKSEKWQGFLPQLGAALYAQLAEVLWLVSSYELDREFVSAA
jgi:hypothetical protein